MPAAAVAQTSSAVLRKAVILKVWAVNMIAAPNKAAPSNASA